MSCCIMLLVYAFLANYLYDSGGVIKIDYKPWNIFNKKLVKLVHQSAMMENVADVNFAGNSGKNDKRNTYNGSEQFLVACISW